MHRIYLLCLVRMRLKRAANEDSDGQHSGGVRGHAFGLTCIDTDMHAGPRGMHRIYIFGVVGM